MLDSGARGGSMSQSDLHEAPVVKAGGHCQVGRSPTLGWKAGEADGMTRQPVTYPRHRFPAEMIRYAVWLYHVFSLSLRDVGLILAERAAIVSHENIRNWCRKFGADFAGCCAAIAQMTAALLRGGQDAVGSA